MKQKVLCPAAFAAITGSMALGCGFHTYVPQPTIVDRLLTSDHIVLARPDPADPFRFVAVEALEGPLADVELPHLVDSTTRRRFNAEPEARVLFARDGAYGPWERLAYVDEDMQRILDDVLANLPAWGGIGDDRGRYEYFAGLIESNDHRIQRIALRELDQASYQVFRRLPVNPHPETILMRLNNLSEVELVPIRILLLGLSDHPDVADFLRAGVDRSTAAGATARLGAFTTAWVEHSGLEAARILAADYLADRSLPFESREMIIEALAIHSEVREPEVAEAVRFAVASAVRAEPELAPAVARQFGIRNDWSLSAPVEEVLKRNKLSSVSDIILVSQYVALANQADVTRAN